METTQLRPLTLGEILDRTAQLYRTNFLLFAGIFSIYAGVALVGNLGQLGLRELLTAQHSLPRLSWAIYGYMGIEALILFLLIGATIAAISRAVAKVHLGEPVTIRGAYAQTLPRLGRYLWLMTITAVLAWGLFVLLYVGLIAAILRFSPAGRAAGQVATAATPAQQQATLLLGVIFLVFLLLMIPVGVYTVWMNLRYSLAVPACVVEELKARPAIRRSIDLSKGARWRIFVLLLLIGVIKIGLVLLTQSFVFVLAFKHRGVLSPAVSATSQVIAFFTNTFLGPIGAIGVTLFYFDQRVRKEGYDIEWMMQAAGLAQAASLDQAAGPGQAEVTAPAGSEAEQPGEAAGAELHPGDPL